MEIRGRAADLHISTTETNDFVFAGDAMNDGREIAGAVLKYYAIFRIPHDATTKEFLAGCQKDTVQRGSNHYAYYTRGEGPTVLLAHGLHSNLGSLVPIAGDLVAQGFRVVLFDMPAHGEAPGTGTNQVEAREVIHKIAARVGPLAAIVCHSLGSVWALSSWGEAFNAKAVVSIASPSNYRFLVDKFAQLQHLRPEIAEGVARQLERRFGETLWTDCSPKEIVKSIGARGLVVHGNNDDFVPPAHAQEIHANWSGAKLEMIDTDTSHFEIAAAPKVRGLVIDWLRNS